MEMKFFKKALIAFWATWFYIAFFTDYFGWRVTFDHAHIKWSGAANYSYLIKNLSVFSTPEWLSKLFYFGIIVWLLVSSLAFTYAFIAGFSRKYSHWLKSANYAFIISLCLWFVFFIADQLIMNFDLEANHMVQAEMEFLSYLALFILPDGSKPQKQNPEIHENC